MNDSSKTELSPNQVVALNLLLAGNTDAQAAAGAGVARETVTKWRNGNAVFQAAYNAGLQSIYDASQACLLDARNKALSRLIDLVDSDDAYVALKAAGLLLRAETKRPSGEIDAEKIERDNAEAKKILGG